MVYICILVAVVIAAFAEKPGLASRSLLRCGLLALLQRQSKRLGEEPDGDFNWAQCSYVNSRFV